MDLKSCLLGVLEEYDRERYTREAITRALFQARKFIMVHWKSDDPLMVGEWVKNVGNMLSMEKCIYQHRVVHLNMRDFGLPG